MALINEALHEYAELLQSAGFDIYEPSAGWNYFIYSRVVDGRECFGMVAEATVSLEGYSHTMPIAPNKTVGSSMWVPGVPDGYDCLTVDAAKTVASRSNSNPVVGTHSNYRDDRLLARLTKW